jgi:hypothetical protein
MVANKIQMSAAAMAGISFGLALGFGIAAAAAETHVVDNVTHNVVRYETGTPEFSEGTFPAGFVPYRVIKKVGGNQLVESEAVDLGWRLGLLYAIGGAIVGVGLLCGAEPLRVMAAGLVLGTVSYLVAFTMPHSPAETVPNVSMSFLLALTAASFEAIRSATFKNRKGRPDDWECRTVRLG